MYRILPLLILTTQLLSGCFHYVVDSREETVTRNPNILQKQTVYTSAGVSLSDETLHIALDRRCEVVQEVDVQKIKVETINYNTMGAYLGIGTAAAIGLSAALAVYLDADFDCDLETGACPPSAESQKDAAGYVAIGTAVATLIGTGITVYYDVANFEEETVLDSRREKQTENLGCGGNSWPVGEATLLASSVGRKFYGEVTSTGQVNVNVGDAPREMWVGDAPLELQLPRATTWVQVEIPEPVRRAGLEQSGETLVSIKLSFDDSKAGNDGALDAGESARVAYTIVNNGDATVRNLSLTLDAETSTGLDIESPAKLGSIGPGETSEGFIDISATQSVDSRQEVLDGQLLSDGGVLASDRLRMQVNAASDARRAWIYYDADKKYQGLLEAGSTRLQSVLTEGRQFQFVSDDDTRNRINEIVEEGGGSLEQRRKSAIAAARQENISRVFQLSVTPISGSQVQLVLSVYDTVGGDRIFLKDAPADTDDAFQALNVFDELANAYLEWQRNN